MAWVHSNGYLVNERRIGGKRKLVAVHRELWEEANGPIPDGFVVDHIDRNRLNNSLDNLRLLSGADNKANTKTKFCFKHGRKWRPEVTFRGTKYRHPGFADKALAEEFGELMCRTIKGEIYG